MEGAGRASSVSRRSQPAAAGPEPASRPRLGGQRAQQRPQRPPQGRCCPPPAAAAARAGAPRSWATATTGRASRSDCMPTLPIPGRAEPRSTPPWCARRQAGRARGPAVLLLPLSPTAAAPQPVPTERRPICGSRRTSTLFLVTRRRTAPAGGRAGRQRSWLPILTLISPPLPTTTPHPTQGRQNGGRYASVTRGARSKGIFMCGI